MITFVVVTWNNEELIEDFFSSMKKYCKVEYKVIVVDNCSSDNTVSQIKKYAGDNCKIIENSSNVGFARANNIALHYVDTKYICYINPDIIFIEDITEELIDILNKNKEVGVVGPKLLNKDMSYQKSDFNFEHGFKLIKSQLNIFSKVLSVDKKPKSQNVDWIIGAVMLLSTEDALRIKGFSEEYFMYIEDMDLCKKVSQVLHKKTYFDSNTSIIHLGGQSERKNKNYKKDEIILRNIVLFNKKFYKNEKLAIYELKLCYFLKMLFSKIRKSVKRNEENTIIFDRMKNSYEFMKKYNI